jgi:hypothetical protein
MDREALLRFIIMKGLSNEPKTFEFSSKAIDFLLLQNNFMEGAKNVLWVLLVLIASIGCH